MLSQLLGLLSRLLGLRAGLLGRLGRWQGGGLLLPARLGEGDVHHGVQSDPLVVEQRHAQLPQRGPSAEGHRLGLGDLPVEQHVALLGEQQQRVDSLSERRARRRSEGSRAGRADDQLDAARRGLLATLRRALPPPRAAPCGAALRSAA